MPPAPRVAPIVAGALLCAALAAGPAGALEPQPPRFTRAQMEAALAGAPAFRFVYGTLDPAATATLRERAYGLARRAFGGDSSQVVADRDADERLIASGPVYLLGSPRENSWTRRFAQVLPVQFVPGGFRWRGRLYDRPRDAIHLAWANPFDPRRFLLLSAGNSPAALTRRGGLVGGEDDWRIVRDGDLARSGRFAHDGGRPWRYEPALDRDREAERARYAASLRLAGGAALRVRAPAGVNDAAAVLSQGEALLARMGREGLNAPRGGAPLQLTLYRSLESKGVLTRDTHAEHVGADGAHAARPFGRASLDLWCVAALRLEQAGARESSRFLEPASVQFADRFAGEPLERSCARLYFGGVLPSAAEAATRDGAWRSPLVVVPARALLVRALWQCAKPPARAGALLAWLRSDPPGSLDSLCRAAGVPAAAVERRYRALADSLARNGRRVLARAAREPWRPASGFQRGVCLAHAVGVERGYLSAETARTLAALRDAGADGVSLTPFAWLPDPAVPVFGNSTDGGPDGESDEAVCEAAARAHALGLRVWLAPHVWTRGWAGDLSFGPSGWQRFFDGYGALAIHWALLAEREGMDGFFLGHELASSTAAEPARWSALIGSVRRLYGGLLSYGANWDEAEHVPFWDELDLIGVSFYTPLANAPTRDPGTLRAGAARALAALGALAKRHGRPVLVAELGYPPSPAAAVRPWEQAPGASDLETQRACLEAAIAAMDPCEWLAGVYFWKWGTAAAGLDDGFDLRARPAAAVVTSALRAWQGRPVRVPAATPERVRPGPKR